MGELDSPLQDPSNWPITNNISSISEGEAALRDVQPILDDCMATVAALEDQIHADVAFCQNNCHGDVGLCRACIEGDIAKYVELAGRNVIGCGDKIITAVTQAVADAWNSAFQLGIPPATTEQLAAAAAGQAIPEAVAVVDGNGGIEPPPVPIPVVVVADDLGVITLPDGSSCLPSGWNPVDIYNWGQAFYGNDLTAFVAANPTSEAPGVWHDSTGEHPIPKLCVDPPGGFIIVPRPPTVVPPGVPPTVNPPTGSPPTGNPPLVSPPSGTGGTGGIGPVAPPPPPIAPPGTGFLPGDDPNVCITDLNAWLSAAPSKALGGVTVLQFPTADNFGTAHDVNGTVVYIPKLCPVPVAATTPPVSTPPVHAPTGTPPIFPTGVIACDPSFAAEFIKSLDEYAKISRNDFIEKIVSSLGGQNFSVTDTSTWIPALWGGFVSFASGLVGTIFTTIGGAIGPTAVPLGSELEGTCFSAGFGAAATVRAFASVLGGWFDIVPPVTRAAYEYQVNYLCQYILPSPAESVTAYARGYLSKDERDFILKCQGVCVPWVDRTQQLSYTRIGIQDAYRLSALGLITDDEFTQAWKRQGIDVDKDADKFRDAVQQYPPVGDLVRMLIKGVADPAVVERYKMDYGFDPTPENPAGLWSGKIKQWGNAQGIQDEVAKKYYELATIFPSPGQVNEMLHRLRKDFTIPGSNRVAKAVTADEAYDILLRLEFSPPWADRLLAISYNLPQIRDVRRWFELDIINDEQFKDIFLDRGYSPDDADRALRFAVIDSAPKRAKAAGELPVAEVSKMYVSGLLTEQEARDRLELAGLETNKIATTIDALDVKKKTASRNTIIKSLRQRYFMGEFTDAAAVSQLVDAFMDQSEAERLVQLWNAERRAKQKSPTIAILCKWYGRGQITIDEYLQRVRNLNYDETDALRIVESCQTDIRERRQKEIEAAQRKQQAKEQQANRQNAQLLKQAKADARANKLMHKREHKVVTKNAKGQFTTTTTDTFTDLPDVNVTDISQHVDVTTGTPPGG